MITFTKSNTYNRAKIIYDDEFIFNEIREKFEYKNSAARYSTFAQPIKNPITPLGSYMVGLTEDIVNVAKKYDEISIDPNLQEFINPIRIDKIKYVPESKFKLRDYQLEASTSLLLHGSGMIVYPTGSGKSLIIATILWTYINHAEVLNKNEVCVLLVPNTTLVIQMYKDMIEYGIPEEYIQMFSSKSKELIKGKKIIISNRKWVMTHFDGFPVIKVLFADEVHTLANNKSGKWVQNLPIPIKLGCTGTISNNSKDDEYFLHGVFGPVRSTRSIVKMQEDNYIAKIKLLSIQIEHNPIPRFPRSTYEDICKGYQYEMEWLNTEIKSIRIISKLADKLQGNTLIIFKRLVHGKSIFDELTSSNKHLINGNVDVVLRDEVRGIVEKSDNAKVVAIASTFSTGINIKNIQYVMLVGGGDSLITLIQTIGRGLRLLKGKTHLTLIDVSHNLEYSVRHFKRREKVYNTEYGKHVVTKVIKV